MRFRFVEGLILLVFMFLCVPSPAGAQTVTGTIQGTVADSTGSVLPGVSIQIKNQDTGAARALTTNDQGFYSATFLPVGRYSVTAKLIGFGTIVRDAVDVGLNQTRVADFQLKPASREETVTVVGASPPINTVNAEVKGALTAQQIADKPTLNPAASCRWPRSSPAIRKTRPAARTTRRPHPAHPSISMGRARAAPPFRSTASTTTIPPRTSTGKACRCRPSRNSRF